MLPISVAIPMYNASATIERCFASIVNQIGVTNFETVILDDASTDNSVEIVKNLAKDFPNDITLIESKKNHGVGWCRKELVKHCKGDFIIFLDADDYLDFYALGILSTSQGYHDADIVCGGIKRVRQDGSFADVCGFGEWWSDDENKMDVLSGQNGFITGKLFRKSILESIPMSTRRLAEDCSTLFYAFYNAKVVESTNAAVYVHTHTANSLFSGASHPLVMATNIVNQLDCCIFLKDKNSDIAGNLLTLAIRYRKAVELALKTGLDELDPLATEWLAIADKLILDISTELYENNIKEVKEEDSKASK